jgi:hypothetical protein
MTEFDKSLLIIFMNKYSEFTLEDIYYYDSDELYHTPEYSEIIHSILFLAEQTRKEL